MDCTKKHLGFLLLIIIKTGYAQELTQEILNPDVKELIQIIPSNKLDNNLFLAMQSIYFEGDDYLSILKDAYQDDELLYIDMLNKYHLFAHPLFEDPKQQATPEYIQIASSQRDKSPFLSYFPCHQYQNFCLSKMLHNQHTIIEMETDYKPLLSRFINIIHTSRHYDTLLLSHSSSYVLRSEQSPKFLHLFIAPPIIRYMSDGELPPLIASLETIRHYFQTMSNDQSNVGILRVYGDIISQQQIYYQYLNGLLDTDFITRANGSDLEYLFLPFNTENNKMFLQLLKNEIISYYLTMPHRLLPEEEMINYPKDLQLNEEDELIALLWLNLAGISLSQPLNATLHDLKSKYQINFSEMAISYKPTKNSDPFTKASDQIQSSKFLSYATDEFIWYKNYFANKNINFSDLFKYLSYKYSEIPELNHLYTIVQEIDKIIEEGATNEQIESLMSKQQKSKFKIPRLNQYRTTYQRLKEGMNYQQLVYLKYRILQDGITSSEIPIFLKDMGSKAINLTTKKTYKWNPKTKALWTTMSKKYNRPAIMQELTGKQLRVRFVPTKN